MNRNIPSSRRWLHASPNYGCRASRSFPSAAQRHHHPAPARPTGAPGFFSPPRPATSKGAPVVYPAAAPRSYCPAPPEDNPIGGLAFALKFYAYVGAVGLTWWAFGGAEACVVGLLGGLVLSR
jgi:hypothetical protein